MSESKIKALFEKLHLDATLMLEKVKNAIRQREAVKEQHQDDEQAAATNQSLATGKVQIASSNETTAPDVADPSIKEERNTGATRKATSKPNVSPKTPQVQVK